MSLKNLRRQIDLLDSEILKLIAKRMAYCKQTRAFKQNIEDSVREEVMKKKWLSEAKKFGLSDDFALGLLEHLLIESKHLQKEPYPDPTQDK